jgi:hypothetical protein
VWRELERKSAASYTPCGASLARAKAVDLPLDRIWPQAGNGLGRRPGLRPMLE